MLQGVGFEQSQDRLHLAFVQRFIRLCNAVSKRCKSIFGEANFRGFRLDLFHNIGMALPKFLPKFERLFLFLQRRQQTVQA